MFVVGPMTTVRAPAVAGSFYPASADALRRDVSDLLAHPEGPALATVPKALIVPHAGYIYSGPIAASAYATLLPHRADITRVVLLGPAHHIPVRSIALSSADQFRTPLGDVALDTDGMQRLARRANAVVSADAHLDEHSLEVQLPFLQSVLGAFTLLPIVVGDAAPTEVADVIESEWGGDETLIVISSDLSHYLSDARARSADARTVDDILALRASLGHRQACGATPVNGMLIAARRRGLRAIALDVRNSSQTAGDPDRVVGYASFAFVPAEAASLADAPGEAAAPLNDAQGETLLRLARGAIASALGVAKPVMDDDATWLRAPGATFVTLTLDGDLRGCIGSVMAHRTLREDVRENAVASALHDSRFRPLTPAELRAVRVEVSLLSAPEPMPVRDEADAVATLRPHIDGVVLECGPFRGLFLPQVWEQLPQPRAFLRQLKRKAGLPAEFWDQQVRLSRFTVAKWKERGG